MFMCLQQDAGAVAERRSRPFQSDGDGTALGEGLGVLAVKRLADAERDGDRIHAVVRGIGGASDGAGSAIYAPQTEGQTKAMRTAYEQAGIESDTIELLEAHGTGTRVETATELEGIIRVLGTSERRRPWCGLGSVKSMVGHTKAAAAWPAHQDIMALEHKVLPPTLNVTEPLEALQAEDVPVYVNAEARPWVRSPHHPRRAGVSAFGFGGSNFHCRAGEHGAAKRATDWSGTWCCCRCRQDSRAALAAAVEALDPALSWDRLRGLGAELREGFEPAGGARLCLVLERDGAGLGELKAMVGARRARGADDDAWHLPSGAFYGNGTPAAGWRCCPRTGFPIPGHAARPRLLVSRDARRARARQRALRRRLRSTPPERPHLPAGTLPRRRSRTRRAAAHRHPYRPACDRRGQPRRAECPGALRGTPACGGGTASAS